MRVAIHQPNFLPWTGLFHRISLVDTMILFDHVQAMGGKSWLSRNRVMVGGQAHWLTMPVRKAGRLGQRVREVEINYGADVRRKHLRTIETSYAKSPHGAEILDLVSALYAHDYRHIADLNRDFIAAVCELLSIDVRFVSSSELVAARPELDGASATDLIVGLCEESGASEYVSGTGCLDFIDPSAFERAGIAFHFQAFEQRPYPQQRAAEFVSHLSVIDALSNLGPSGARELLRGGVVPAEKLLGANGT